MTNFWPALVLSVPLTLAGCAGSHLSYPQPPVQTVERPIPFSIASAALDVDSVFSPARKIDGPSALYYYQNGGGGGAALGLLFGVIGAVANNAMIASQSKADLAKLNGKLALDPLAMTINAAAMDTELKKVSDITGAYMLSPFVMITKGDDEKLHFAAGLDVTKGIWHGRYRCHLADEESLDGVAAGLDATVQEKLNHDLSDAFAQTLTMFEADLSGRYLAGKEISFTAKTVQTSISFSSLGKFISDDGQYVTILGFLGAPGPNQFGDSLVSGVNRFPKGDIEISK